MIDLAIYSNTHLMIDYAFINYLQLFKWDLMYCSSISI